jgi:signal transduction histidine kinase
MLINHTARSALDLADESLLGRPARDMIQNTDLLDMINPAHLPQPRRSEITLEDGRVFNAQLTPIPEVGLAITMQDITHLKELDRIKSDFVSTVSHDLRSQ